ncbi:glucose dehydrogenase [Candidatus Heimdallarchaeota archaeon B3_Heim]|nr:MAG: glucose dehydrogenase [Candidatus Heimdallarchaeota archaeon B3_Heim]
MKAIAVIPKKKGSLQLIDQDKPSIDQIQDHRGVLIRVLQCGVDGTDKEIVEANYGNPPLGDDHLILGHECLGIVEKVDQNVTELNPGDFVVPTVRRACGNTIYDTIGTSDVTTADTYCEHGINLLHGFLTEYFIDQPENLVRIPSNLKEVAVLLEPTSIVEKGIMHAVEIQRRLKIWRPKRAAVLGAGPIGILAALMLRLRGIETYVISRTQAPYLNSDLVEEIEAKYISTKDISFKDAADKFGPFDIIFEATGFSPLVFEAMELLGKNGILILSSITANDRKVEISADKINLDFVLGNKVCFGTVNANREHFEQGVRDLSQALLQYPNWLSKLLTHPIKGLDQYEGLVKTLCGPSKGVIKLFCEVSPFPEQ